MHQLSGLDAGFLHLETAEMPMHVGALHLLTLPPGFRGRFATALRRHLRQRLPDAPVLRRRVWTMPLNLANPAWVDAEPDLQAHVVEIRLPRGAGMAELEAEVGRLHGQRLDRARPLWKMHVFEGLAPGRDGLRRVGLYTQLHHAAVDGQAAVALATVLLDTRADPPARGGRRPKLGQTTQLGMVEMLRGALAAQAGQVAQIVKELPSTVGTLKDAALLAASRSALFGGGARGGRGRHAVPSNLTLAPRTPFNTTVGTERAFATASLPLGELRALAEAFGCTINDLVLALCSSALRRWLLRRRALPRQSLVAAVPISLRAAGDTRADNQASLGLVSLGTQLADPAKRLAHVCAASAGMKQSMGSLRPVLPTDYPSLGIPWLIEAAASLYGRLRAADRLPQVANLVISNVPGPEQALYLAGARMLSIHPASIVVHGLALNITAQSFDRSLGFGLTADAHAVPDLHELARGLQLAHDELLVLAAEQVPDEPAPTLAGLARRGLGQAVDAASGIAGRAARGAVDAAVRGAVSQVTGRRSRGAGGLISPRKRTGAPR